jgi:transcriptional regulator with XRE-family HTH domain
VDQRSVSEFLRTRRDRLTPEQVGIIGGGRRRVAGLRREEVAFLAGVSVDYYARMERGDLSGVSAEVLDSLATALRLDDAESEHLHDLAAATSPRSGRRRHTQPVQTVPPRLQRFLDSITGSPVWVRDRRMDYVTANALGRALYAPILENPVYRGNTARFMFLSITAPTLFPDWDEGADTIVATLRDYAGKHPGTRA